MSGALDPQMLEGIALFQDLSPAQLSTLCADLKRKTFAAGTNLLTVGQSSHMVYIIRHGTVKVHVEQPDGTDVVFAILGRGEVLGDMSVVDGGDHSATVVAMEETSVLWVHGPVFQRWLQTIPTITYNLVRILSQRLRQADEQIQSFARLDVYGRIASRLLTFARQYGEAKPNGDIVIPVRLTQGDLADLIGASRVRVNQVLVAYKRWRYISVDQQYYTTVHNARALAQRCRELTEHQTSGISA